MPTINSYVLQQHLPNAQLIIYPDSAHGSHFQFPELFASHLAMFLDADESDSPRNTSAKLAAWVFARSRVCYRTAIGLSRGSAAIVASSRLRWALTSSGGSTPIHWARETSA